MYNLDAEIRKVSGAGSAEEGALIAKAKVKLFSQVENAGFAGNAIGSTSLRLSVQLRYDLIKLINATSLEDFMSKFIPMKTRIKFNGKGYIVESVTLINPMVMNTRPNKLKFKAVLQ